MKRHPYHPCSSNRTTIQTERKQQVQETWSPSEYPPLNGQQYNNKIREKSRECHNHKPQPFPYTKRKWKPTNPNKHKSSKRTKSTKISSLFPKRGNCNAKRTDNRKHCDETKHSMAIWRTTMNPTIVINSQVPTIGNRWKREPSFNLRTDPPSCNLRGTTSEFNKASSFGKGQELNDNKQSRHQPNHCWWLCYTLYLHDGGSGLRLNDGLFVKVGWGLTIVLCLARRYFTIGFHLLCYTTELAMSAPLCLS